jgi:hypothetical protein
MARFLPSWQLIDASIRKTRFADIAYVVISWEMPTVSYALPQSSLQALAVDVYYITLKEC